MLEFFSIQESVVGGWTVLALYVEDSLIYAEKFDNTDNPRKHQREVRRATRKLVKRFLSNRA